MSAPILPDDILRFWFDETPQAAWWAVDAAFDALVRRRFLALLQQAAAGELHAWRDNARGRLAEVIVLDQLPRNIHRDTAQAFAYDPMALVLSQEAVRSGALAELPAVQCSFLLMPYMHSESAAIHALADPLFSQYTQGTSHAFELKHRAIIDRFGRYPHRNAQLGREPTPEETAFLQEPGSSF